MKNNNKKNNIEHRGYDKSATKNFDLEMKFIKNSYRATHSMAKQSDMTKYIK